VKPWNLNYNRATQTVQTDAGELEHVVDFARVWWQIFMEDIHYRLIADLASVRSVVRGAAQKHPTTKSAISYKLLSVL